MVTTISNEVQEQVRELVFMLMKRPITEEIAMQITEISGFEQLEIRDGEWTGFDKDDYMGGEEHGWIESLILHAFTSWILAKKTGRVYPGDTDFVLDGDRGDIRLSRRPDVGFVLDVNVHPTRGYIFSPPDVAVEIISPTERPGAIRKKLNEYLEHGVKQVWQVYPDNQEIVVNFPDGSSKTYGIDDEIPGGELLPGFDLKLATIFEETKS